MKMSRATRTLTAGALLAAATITGGQVIRTTRAEAVTLAQDPDRNINTVTNWIYYFGQTPSQVTTRIGSSYRLTDLEVTSVDGSGVPTMTMVAVANSGSYARSGWSWKTGLTSTQVASTLGSTYRLIDLERYVTASGARYAIVYVPNTGAQQKVQGYFLGKTSTQVSSILSANGARLIDMEVYAGPSSNLINGIWVKNTGVDARTWHYWFGQTTTSLATHLSDTGERVLSLERRANGAIDAITVKDSAGWWYNHAQSASAVGAMASQLGARISRLEPLGNGTYDVVLLENLPAETIRVRELARSKMGPYNWGFYVKRVGSSVAHNLQADTVFEPASAIKVLHHLMEMRRVASGTDTLSTRMDWYKNPDRSAENTGDGPNTCPDYVEDSTTAVRTSTRQAMYGMMWDSDNRLTRAFTIRHGLANMNAYADTLGMTRTELRQARVGCGWDGGFKNDTTLRDLGRLYEAVSNSTALASSQEENFIDLMINSTGAGGLDSIINAEGASLGKSADIIAAFKARIRTYSKGGSYSLCVDLNDCNPHVDISTVGGVLQLPLRAGGTVDFVYGRFMQAQVNCAPSASSPCATIQTARDGLNAIRNEMFRSSIRSVLAGW